MGYCPYDLRVVGVYLSLKRLLSICSSVGLRFEDAGRLRVPAR